MVGGIQMKNPLNKRLLRELKRDVAKYIVIFLFMILMIGFVSGFMISVESMRVSYVEGFEKLHVEHGNFELAQPIEDALIKHLEDENITVFENHYFEEETVDFDSKLRVYHTRDGIDEVSVIEGVMPKASDEIAIDRMYADNNGLHVGDTLRLGEHTLQITALVALADYTSL